MKKIIVKIMLGITCSIIMAGTGFVIGNEYGKSNSSVVQQNEAKTSANTIAVVNMDDGLVLDGEQINYASHFMELPDNGFVQTGLEDAKSGVNSGKYAAYIVIPADFSQSVESISSTPQSAVLEYNINSNLNADAKANAVYNVLNFQKSLNSNVAYTYIDSIMTEFHNVQDSSSQILINDQTELTNINNIQADSLIAAVDFSELKQVENTVTPANLDEYYEKNGSIMNDMSQSFQNSIQQSADDFELIRSSQQTLNQNADQLLTGIGNMDLLSDENGESVLAAGSNQMEQSILELLNSQIEEHQDFVNVTLQKNVDEQFKSIQQENQEAVNAGLEDIQTNLESEIGNAQAEYASTVQQKYEDAVKTAIETPSEEGQSLLSDYSNSEREVYQTYVDEQLAQILAEVQSSSQPIEGAVQDGSDPVQDGSDPVQVDTGQYHIDLSQADLSTVQFGEVKLDQVDLSDVPDISVADITNDITLPQAVSQEEADKDSDTQVWIEVTKDMSGNDLLLKPVEEESVSPQIEQWIQEDITIPLKTNTDTKIADMKNMKDDVAGSMDDYQQSLTDFDPFKYYQDAEMGSYLGDMESNMQMVQEQIDTSQQQYDDYVNLVSLTADENVMSLQQDMSSANETTAQNIEAAISSLQSSSEYTYGQNAGMLEDFTKKLPYTRVGSVENTQVYDFMVEPVQMKSSGNAAQKKYKQ